MSALKKAIAVTALSLSCSVHAAPAINRVFVEPGRSDPGSYVLETTPNPSDGGLWYGRALAFEALVGSTIIKKVIYTYYSGGDVGPGPLGNFYRKVSTDGGFTFTAPVLAGTRKPAPAPPGDWDFDLSVSIKRRNGTIFLMPNSPSTSFIYHTSTDNGATWTKSTNGTVSASIGVWHRSIIEENNGDLYSCAYNGTGVQLAKSTNGGVAWTALGMIATGPYNEACLERCANGSWLCIARESGSTFKAMRSTNTGSTWTAPAALPVAVEDRSIDPCLKLMPNGVLVFSYGGDQNSTNRTRDVKLAFSADGNGTTWTNVTNVFTGVEHVDESTGYTCVWPIKAHSFMQSSDYGNNRNYTDVDVPPGGYYLWARQANIALTGFEHRIDLKTKQTLVADIIDSTTTMTHSPAGHVEGRSTGAFDGSTDYWSGAFSSGTSGTFVIDLQQNYTLTGLGVCLQYNTSESATIAYSSNGSTWATLKTYTNATHRAMDYTTLTPVSARYVRATVTAASGLACLGEIELYTSSMETFENSAGVPVGYSAPVGGFTSYDGAGYQSQRGLRLWDQDPGQLVTAGRTTTFTATKTLEFWIQPRLIANAIQARITSGLSNVFRISFDASGNIKYLNSAGAYVNTTGTGSPATGVAPLMAWNHIRLVADAVAGTAQLFVNGLPEGIIGKETGTAFTTLNGFSFNSGSTPGTADGAYFDDVKFN